MPVMGLLYLHLLLHIVILRRTAIMSRVTIGTVAYCCNILRVPEAVWMRTCGCADRTPGAAAYSVDHYVRWS